MSKIDILVNTPGTKLKKEKKYLVVENKKLTKRIPLKDVKTISLGENILVSVNSLLLMIEENIAVFLVNWKNEVIGEISNVNGRSKGKRLINQLNISNDVVGLKLSRSWIIEKIQKIIEHLEELKSNKKKIEEIKMVMVMIKETTKKESIRGFEGRVGRIYFKELRKFSNSEERILPRNQRPAIDSFNQSLNYTYGILYRKLNYLFLIYKVEPTIGFFHTNESNKDALVFDFIERYRIYFLKNIYALFQKGEISRKLYEKSNEKYVLTKEGKYFLRGEFDKVLRKRAHKKSKLSLEEQIREDIKELREIIDDFSSI